MVASREYQTAFSDDWRVCRSLMVVTLREPEWEALNFRLSDGDVEWNPFSWNQFWRIEVCSIYGFIKTVVLEIVPTVFPLNYVTWPPLIATSGGVGKPWRLESSAPSIWQWSPQSVMSILFPDMSRSPIVHLTVSTPSHFRIVDDGETEITRPTRSTMELTVYFVSHE